MVPLSDAQDLSIRVAHTRAARVTRNTRAALRRGRGSATADVPRALTHAPRGAAAEVLHRHNRGDRPRGRLHVRVRVQPRVRAAPRPAPRPLPAARERRVTVSRSRWWTVGGIKHRSVVAFPRAERRLRPPPKARCLNGLHGMEPLW